MHTITVDTSTAAAVVPLVVDLDGTLIGGDLLAETLVSHLAARPFDFPVLFRVLQQGKAHLKHYLVDRHPLDPSCLPYQEPVMALIGSARAEGRPVFLATASHEKYAAQIAEYLGLFDGVFATNPSRNLADRAKAELLKEEFGEGGFDYIGNSTADLAVWRYARRCYTIGIGRSVKRRLHTFGKEVQPLDAPRSRLREWAHALRVHQYAKNLLIFVPVGVSQVFGLEVLLQALIAFISFSLAASAIYLVNDMVDIADDRAHPRKRNRPLASGAVSIHGAVAAVPVLLILSALLALALPTYFLLVLAAYLAMTTAYSFSLKRKMLVDVIVLALLYTVRVFAGSAATGITLSAWLLAFCLFAFSSLALIKRYTELLVRLDSQLPDANNRNYQQADLPVIASLAAATGVNTVTVLALYIQSPEVVLQYQNPQILLLLCPLILFLLSRALLMSHRRFMDDDPMVWALKDSVSRFGVVFGGAILLSAALL